MTKPTNPSTHKGDEAELQAAFADIHPPLSASEALIEADRCYFCYDAPCTIACPTDIDIPRFIQSIRSGDITGSARAILSENIMGGMCARVCPTEVLCEQDCVRNTHEDKPVEIGLLQRHATDPILDAGTQLFERAPDSGKTVAVVGAGPAGLSCAHRLAMLGHAVVIFEAAPKPGGLNEYGIAAYKTVDNFAQREVDYILGIGGIAIKAGTLGDDLSLASLRDDYDAVFLGIGLGDVNALGLDNEDTSGVYDAVDYIADLRQTDRLSNLPVAREVVVIGGGMTAIDIAVQSKKLGAESVTLAYRRGRDRMNASEWEQELAQKCGVLIRPWLSPSELIVEGDQVTGVRFARTSADDSGKLKTLDETVDIPCQAVFKAIGQKAALDQLGDVSTSVELEHKRIKVNDHRQTSLSDVWAGGDCVDGGDDLTVSAVQDGKLAALSIDHYLRQ